MNKQIQHIALLFLIPVQLTAGLSGNLKQTLFSIERSRSEDAVVYELNMDKSGNIDHHHPINTYWRNGKVTSPLTFIQKKYGYGTHIVKNSSDELSFTIKALPDHVFTIDLNSIHPVKTYVQIDDKTIKVESIYIQFEPGTAWSPDIEYVQLKGRDKQNKVVIEKIINQ